MSQKSSAAAAQPSTAKPPAEKLVRDIRRATRKHHSAEDKIRIVLEGMRGEESIAALCRSEAIAESLYYAWSREFGLLPVRWTPSLACLGQRFEIHRTEIADGRVASPWVVDALDVVEHIGTGLGRGPGRGCGRCGCVSARFSAMRRSSPSPRCPTHCPTGSSSR